MKRGEKGQILPLVMILLFLGAILLAPVLAYNSTTLKTTVLTKERQSQYYAAEAGIEDALWKLITGEIAGDSPEYDLARLNDNDLHVTMQCLSYSIDPPDMSYIITSTATGTDGSHTAITIYTSRGMSLLDFAASAEEGIVLKGAAQQAQIIGPQQKQTPLSLPSILDFQNFYLLDIDTETTYPVSMDDSIDVDDNNPIPDWYSNGGLNIKSGTASFMSTLGGTVYVTGGALDVGTTGNSFTLDLGGNTLFCDSTAVSNIGTKLTITGSGAIITVGDIIFKPNMASSPTDFVFVLSLSGQVIFQPGGNYYGSVAAAGADKSVSIELYSGNTLTHTNPPSNLNIPITGTGTGWSIHTWQITR